MSIFNRLSDIINANLNAMLEQAEDPEKIIRMITQEMEETLVEVRSMSARYIADKKVIQGHIRMSEQRVKEWEERAELAITKGRDDLARAALKEKAHYEEQLTADQAELVTVDEAIEKLKSDAEQLGEKLSYARARQKAVIVRGQTVKSRARVKRQLHSVSINDAFERFESYERKIDEMEGEVEALELGNQSLADQIRSLEADEALDAELAALKARVQGTPAQTSVQ